MRIVVSHPHGNPNSYQAARALAEADWLDVFETGFVPPPSSSYWFWLLSPEARSKRAYEGIPRERLRGHFMFESFYRLGSRLNSRGLAQFSWYDLLFWGHDAQVARCIPVQVDGVYAYEDGAWRTFAAAKKRGISTFYELPAGYFGGVVEELRLAQRERPRLQVDEPPPWKRERKNAELACADAVVVPCSWAKRTLRFSGIADTKPVITLPYGTPADTVLPRSRAPVGPFTVLFAGAIGVRKGVPYLLEAWRRLQLPSARLWLAGSWESNAFNLEDKAGIEHLGALPHMRLLEIMRQVDLLVFPSLGEGFGLVIGEAMACGLPVLTTVNTGGPELITDGREGWCVAARDVDALCDRLRWAYHHRDELDRMGHSARAKAEQWTWRHYRKRLIEELSGQLN